MDSNLVKTLQQYGLSEKEAKIYLVILEMWSAAVSVIARRSGVKRVTVYAILEELKKKEIAHEIIKNDIKYYSVIDPDKLFKDFEKKYKNFKDLLPEFLSIKEKYGDRPRMQFFDWKDSVNEMLYDYSYIWIKSIANYDNTWRWYQDHEFVEQHIDRLNRYWWKKNPWEKINLFSNKAEIEDKIWTKLEKSNQRIIKTIPKWFNFTNTIWILWDYIVMIMNREEKYYAFQIQDKEFALNLRELFKVMRNIID